jgi:hypothetical protein
MPETQSSRPKSIRLKIAGKTYVATYDVQDDCVQVTLKGRRSTWTQLRGLRAEDVARSLLKELIGVLLVVVCLQAYAEQRLGPKRPHLQADNARQTAYIRPSLVMKSPPTTGQRQRQAPLSHQK